MLSSSPGPGSAICGADGVSIGRSKSNAIAVEPACCDGPTYVSSRRGRGAGSAKNGVKNGVKNGWMATNCVALVFAFLRLGAVLPAILPAATRFLFGLGAWAGASSVIATGKEWRGMSFHQFQRFRQDRTSIV